MVVKFLTFKMTHFAPNLPGQIGRVHQNLCICIDARSNRSIEFGRIFAKYESIQLYKYKNTFIDKYFIKKRIKLYNAAGVDSTSKLIGFIKLLHFQVFQYFLSSKSTFRIYPQTGRIQFQKREKLNTHISTLIKMFAKLISGCVQVMIRLERC